MIESLSKLFDPETGEIAGMSPKFRLLDSMRGFYLDESAFDRTLQEQGNIPVYGVNGVETATGDGQLHYGIGRIMPGKIGHEYFFTAGHFHAYRPAAEIYIGFAGEGMMLLQDETSGESRALPLAAGTVIYVPGYTAHRTVNTGTVPLTYIGIYPANAGHDYGSIAEKNFNHVVIEINGKPAVIERREALEMLRKER
jgi:glucose-6-phosphate isomerase, archaeal